MLQPRRREDAPAQCPSRRRNNGLIYTTLLVLLSVATFNYAVGLAVAESDISRGQPKEATSSGSSSSGSIEAIVGAVENGPLNQQQQSNEQPDVTHDSDLSLEGTGGRRHNKKLVQPIIGLVSTTERTFIDNGVTTQYGTAVYGTEIKNGDYYVQFLTTNTKILYEMATKSAAEELKKEASNIFNADNEFDIGNVHTILIQPKSPLPAYLERTRPTPALEETDEQIVTSVVTSSSSSSSSSSAKKSEEEAAGEKKKGKSLNAIDEEKLFRFNEILPTFTVAQEGVLYETATPSLSPVTEQAVRSNKAIELNNANFFVGSDVKAAEEESDKEEAVELKSTTYYGFSEFTTIVGDTRIVFLPSSMTPDSRDGIQNNINIAPTATWTSEVKSVDASAMHPQAKFKPKTKPLFKNPLKTTTTTTTSTTTEKNIEDNEIIKSETPAPESVEAETAETEKAEEPTQAPKVLTIPTNDDIIKIFNSLKQAELERASKHDELEAAQKTSTTTETASTSTTEEQQPQMTPKIEATPASKETLINSGVTTIFFEPDFEDPFAVIEREEQEKKAQEEQAIIALKKKEQEKEATTEDMLTTIADSDEVTSVAAEVDEQETTTLKLETTSKAAENESTESSVSAEESTTLSEEISASESTTLKAAAKEKEEMEEDRCAKLIITTTIPTFKTLTLLTTLYLPNSDPEEKPEERVETNVITSTELNKLTITPAIYLDLGCQSTALPTLSSSSTTTTSTSSTTSEEDIKTTTEQKPESETEVAVTEEKDEEEPEEVVEAPMKKQYSSIDRPRTTTEDAVIGSRFNNQEEEDEDRQTVTENILEIVTEKRHVTSSSDEDLADKGNAIEVTTVSETPEGAAEEEEEEAITVGAPVAEEPEENDDDNVIWKTLYTTYTYLTTFFQESTSSVSSRREVVTNVVKSTLPADAMAQMGLDFIEATPTDNVGVGRPTILAFDQFDALFGSTDESDVAAADAIDSGNGVKTYYTTYTYFTTIFVDGETEVSSRTEVYTNFVTPTQVLDVDMNTKAPVTAAEVEESLINENRVGKSYTTMTRKIDENVEEVSEADKTSEESVTKMVTNTKNSTSKVNNIVEMVKKAPAPIPDQDESESKNYVKQLDPVLLEASEEEIRPTALALSSDEPENGNKTTTLLLQTSYTTFTYFTTMYIGTESSNVLSRLETLTNIVTETLKEPSETAQLKTKLNEIDSPASGGDAVATKEELDKDLPITYFTTFTYWTTIFKDGNTVTTSREETVSNVVEPTTTTVAAAGDTSPTATTNADLKTIAAKALLDGEPQATVLPVLQVEASGAANEAAADIQPTSITTYYTTYTYYTTSYIGEETVLNSHFETVTNVQTPEIAATSTVAAKSEASSRALNLGETIEDVKNELDEGVLPKPTNTPPLEDFVKTTNLLRINYGKIVDREHVSTIHYKTLTLATTIDNIQAEVLQSTRSIEVDEKRKAELATVEKDSGSLKTGLVRQIDGYIVNKNATNVLTQYQSKIIGTVIDGRYAQIIESRTDILTPTATKASPLETAVRPVKVPELKSSKAESTTQKEGDHEEEEGDGEDEDEEGEDEEGRPKGRLSFQSRKKTFTPIIRPFVSRNRPTFAPKRKQVNTNAGPQTVTRSDATPTITATPALTNTPSNVRTRLRGSSSINKFALRSSSGSFKSSSSSTVGGGSSGGPSSSTRGRFAVSRTSNAVQITPTRSRPSGLRSSIGGQQRPAALLTPSSRINRFRSSSFGGISASRTEKILKTKSFTPTTDAPSDDNTETTDADEEAQEEVKEVEVTTSKNPLIGRFRPRPIASLRSSNRGGSTTTTTTTTPKPKRSFKRPPALSFQPNASPSAATPTGSVPASERFSRPRANNLFPARGLFKTTTTTTEAPAEADEDFVDEDEEQPLSRKKRQLYHSRLRSTPAKKPTPKKYEEDYEVEYVEYYEDGEPVPTTTKKPVPARGPNFRNRNTATKAPATTQRPTTLRSNSNIRASNPQNFRQQFTIRDNSFYKPQTPTTQAPVVTTPSRRRPPIGGSRSNRVSTTRKATPTAPPRNNRLRSNTNTGYQKSSFSRNSGTTRSSNSRGSSSTRPRARHNYNQNIGATNAFVDDSFLDSTAVTVTHYIPSETTIPFGNDFKTIVTQKQSTEVVPRKGLKTYQNTLFLNKESTLVNPQSGATEVIQYYLKETETTSVIFTPTTIRGRRTSYSHIVPSTVYNVEMTTVTQVPSLADSIGNPAAPLANILLSQLLLGNLGGSAGNNINNNLGLSGLNPLAGLPGQAPVDLKPQTEYKTRTTTYVTTLTDQKSTVLPLTFQGKKFLTTIFDNKQDVITATEFITDTIVITPTPALQQIQQTQPQFNSLLLPLLLQQQQQQQQVQLPTVQQVQPQDQLQQLAQLLPKDNFVDTNEQGQSQEEVQSKPVVKAAAEAKPKKIAPKKIAPKNTEVITLYISGRKPGEFSTVLSTIISDGEPGDEDRYRRRRDTDGQTPELELESTETAFSGHHIRTRALDDLVQIDSTNTILFGVGQSDQPRVYQTAAANEHFLA